MKFDKIRFEDDIEKEWIITNGIGGYASSTMLGINTRKYHGLLVAALTPPAQRNLILSKVDESIEIDGTKYDLYSNMGKNYLASGYQYIAEFEKEYVPIYTYKVNRTIIKKYICMVHEQNTVVILYRVYNLGKKAKLTLTPLLNFRDFHRENYNHEFNIKQEIHNNKVKIVLDGNSNHPIYIMTSEGKYIEHDNDSYKNMFYVEEEKRGFNSEEDHAIAGRYEIEINENQQKDITFVCSLEENIDQIDGKDVISKEIARISSMLFTSKLEQETKLDKKLLRDYIEATDNFVVYRPSFRLHTLIAGYPWFLDWGRDSLISFEGLLLKTKRYDIAREILLTTIRDIKFGLVPNGYSGYDNRPLYNSADSSLLLFEQVKKYLNYTQDTEFVKLEIYPALEKIIDSYRKKIDVDGNNIYLDEDGLISSGTEKIQNTWMDAKIGDEVVTPRNGKTVEINSMWYNALKIMEELCAELDSKEKSVKYKRLAEKCKKSFNEKFYNKKKKCLFDVLGDSKIRPNQLFALSLTYPIIEPDSEIAKEMFETVSKKLLNNYGLKTLEKGEENYVEIYEGDSLKRDRSYHQGITWPWLLGLYYDSFKKIIEAEKDKETKKKLKKEYKEFVENVKTTFINEFTNGKTIGGISELYDSIEPYKAKGAFEQAWSVAEIFRIIIEN